MALCRRVAYETLNEHGDEVRECRGGPWGKEAILAGSSGTVGVGMRTPGESGRAESAGGGEGRAQRGGEAGGRQRRDAEGDGRGK